nr:hypothetical protein 68B2.170 [imported] - Neurospora crassa [Neurospora crassa]
MRELLCFYLKFSTTTTTTTTTMISLRGNIPKRSNGNIDRLIPKEIGKILGGPCLGCLPVCGTASYDKRGVPSYESHKLERTGLFVELLDEGAVEFIVGDDQVCNSIAVPFLLFLSHVYFQLGGI